MNCVFNLTLLSKHCFSSIKICYPRRFWKDISYLFLFLGGKPASLIYIFVSIIVEDHAAILKTMLLSPPGDCERVTVATERERGIVSQSNTRNSTVDKKFS